MDGRRLIGGRRGRPGRRVGVRRELVFFYGVAALALIVVSIGAVVASRMVARTEALQDAEGLTARLAELLIGPLLGDALNGDSPARAELDQAIANRMADGYLTEVTIWEVDGTVVYADDPAEIGRRLDPPAEVTAAINQGVVSSAFEDQPEATDEQFNSADPGFVEVYVPFDVPGQPRFAFEAYYDYARVNDAANSLLWHLVPLVLVPLLLVQVLQSPIPAVLARRVRGHEEERSELLERALSVSDRERVRVAADLHDGPIQDLAGVTYALDAVSGSVLEPYRPLMREVQTSVTHAIMSLRRLMVDLYPPDLSAEQLPETISNLAVPLRDRGVAVAVTVEPLPELDNDTVTALYRVAREALANVAEHAEASQVEINLEVTDADGLVGHRIVRLTITDNGVGLDIGRLDRRAEGHLGLRLLIDRVESLGGTVTLTAGPNGGTTVIATLPIGGQPTEA